MCDEQHLRDLSLVLVGREGWLNDALFQAISESRSVRDRIIVTGYVPDTDLAPFYSGALAFVYPSVYEGFGLPVLEAMQCGAPVVTSNTSSLPEVVGEAGIMVDPADADALCAAMYELYSDPCLREDLAHRSMERAGQFSWDKCVQETLQAYRTSL
jgi:glycosyltransferase involved in cell wall biosynthesis